jgi:hypothetical protein
MFGNATAQLFWTVPPINPGVTEQQGIPQNPHAFTKVGAQENKHQASNDEETMKCFK